MEYGICDISWKKKLSKGFLLASTLDVIGCNVASFDFIAELHLFTNYVAYRYQLMQL